MSVLVFLACCVSLFFGYWLGKKDATEMDEVDTLQECIITDLEGYLKSKPALTSFEATLKAKIAHLRDIW